MQIAGTKTPAKKENRIQIPSKSQSLKFLDDPNFLIENQNQNLNNPLQTNNKLTTISITNNNKSKNKNNKEEKNNTLLKNDAIAKIPITNKNQVQIRKNFTLNSHLQTKKNSHAKSEFKRESLYSRIMHRLHSIFEHIAMQIFIILLSVFSLFHEDIKILSLPKSVDYPFHHLNEFIFFFFLLEFLVFMLSDKEFIGSFYFYLDIVSLISLIPEVHIFWDPILQIIEADRKIKEVLGNSHLAKASRASQAGSKASKYLRLLKLVSFIKVVRVAKVVAHTNQIEKKIENKNHKVGINIDSASIQSLMKKRTIRITNNYSLNEIALFLKYQNNPLANSVLTHNPNQFGKNLSKYGLSRVSLRKTSKSVVKKFENKTKPFTKNSIKDTNSHNLKPLFPLEKSNTGEENNDQNTNKNNNNSLYLPKSDPKKEEHIGYLNLAKTSDRHLDKFKFSQVSGERENDIAAKLVCKQEIIEMETFFEPDMFYDNNDDNFVNNVKVHSPNESKFISIDVKNNNSRNKIGHLEENAIIESHRKNLLVKSEGKIKNRLTDKNKIKDNYIDENKNISNKNKNLIANNNKKNNINKANKVLEEPNDAKNSNLQLEKKHAKNLRLKSANSKSQAKHVKIINAALRSSKDFLNKDLQSFKQNNILLSNTQGQPEKANFANTSKNQTAFIQQENKPNPEASKNANNQEQTLNSNLISAKINFALSSFSSSSIKKGCKNNDYDILHKITSNNHVNFYSEKEEADFLPKIKSIPSIKHTEDNNSPDNNISFRSFSRASSVNDIMDAEEEEKIEQRIKMLQNNMTLIINHKGQSRPESDKKVLDSEEEEEQDYFSCEDNLQKLKKLQNDYLPNYESNQMLLVKGFTNSYPINKNKSGLKSNNINNIHNCNNKNKSNDTINNNNNSNSKKDFNLTLAKELTLKPSEDSEYLREIESKANLKLDKKLTQKFTNRIILIILLLLVILPIIDTDFLFDFFYPKNIQPNYKFFCMDMLFLYMNLSLSNPDKYLSFFNSTLETCFYGYGYTANFSSNTSEKGKIVNFPKDLEFFLQLNFSEIFIFQEFNDKTNFFKSDFIELNYFKNYTKTLREDIDYFEESYVYDENIAYNYYTNKVAVSVITSVLSIFKSLFVAVLLVFGTFLFTKDLSFFVISPLERLFAKLEMLFNNNNNNLSCNFHEHLQFENELLQKEKNESKGFSLIKVENKALVANACDDKLLKKNTNDCNNWDYNNLNLKNENFNLIARKSLENDVDLELGRGNAEKAYKLKNEIETKGNCVFETSFLKKKENHNFDFNIDNNNKINNYDKDLKKNQNKINKLDIEIDNNNNKNNKDDDSNKLAENAEKLGFFPKQKSKKFALEIEKIDFSIMKLLDLISVSIGNPMLMMIPNCDLEKDLIINLKSPSVVFEGFALMLNFSNRENLVQKIGAKASKYFNRVISLFHTVGLILYGQPYKIDEVDLIVWRKDKNSYTKNMFNYIQGINQQLDPLTKALTIDVNVLEKSLIPESMNSFLSEISGNICCMAGIKFINFLLLKLRKTINLFSEAGVGINLYCDFGTFHNAYAGSIKKMNEVLIGKPIRNLKKITSRTKPKNPNYPSLFLTENFLTHLDETIKKNIILFDVFDKTNLNTNSKKNKQNKQFSKNIYRHYINYEKLFKEISLFNPCEKMLAKPKDYYDKTKLNIISILKEQKEFLEKLKKEKNNFLLFISADKVYFELTANLNPIYKNLVNFAFEAYLINNKEKAINVFEDLHQLLKINNDNCDLVFNKNIKGWIELIKKCKK